MKAKDHPAFQRHLSQSVKVAEDIKKLQANIAKKKGQ